MKRLLAALAALMLALAAIVPALAEEEAYTLEGFVTATTEDGFTIDDKTQGAVQLNVDATTVYDGILADSPIEAGLYVFVTYDGKMTRSIPPQAHADKVGCYVLNGVAGEFLPDGVMLTGDELFGDVFVRFEPSMAHVYPGVPMTVYYNGIMALSLPGQVGAAAIIVPVFEGEISDINEDGGGFTLRTDDGGSLLVTLDGATLIGRLANADEGNADSDFDISTADSGESADSADEGESLANADWIIDTEVGLRKGYELLSPEALSVGDNVRVYYNGEQTVDNVDIDADAAEAGESTPRVYALEVLVVGE